MDKYFLILVLMTPLVILSQIQLGYEIGKMWWWWLWTQMWLWARLASGRVSLTKLPGIWQFGLWLLFGFVSSLVIGRDAIWGSWYRMQGFVSWLHFGITWYLVATARVGEGWMRKWLYRMGVITVMVGIIVGGVRWGGSLGEANNFGLLAVMVSMLGVGKLQKLVGIVGLVGSQSRAALLSFASNVKIGRWVGSVVILLLVIATLARFDGGRTSLIYKSLEYWRTSPWIGIGFDSFRLGDYDSFHNWIVQMLVTNGSLGLGLFVGWIFVIWKEGVGIWRRLFNAMLVWAFFQPISTTWMVYLAIVAGRKCFRNDHKEFDVPMLVKLGYVIIGFVITGLTWKIAFEVYSMV